MMLLCLLSLYLVCHLIIYLAFYAGWLALQENLLEQLLSVMPNATNQQRMLIEKVLCPLPAISGREIQGGKQQCVSSLFLALAFHIRKSYALEWGLQTLADSLSGRRCRRGLDSRANGKGRASARLDADTRDPQSTTQQAPEP
ncbi:hypothetical protein E2542_SST23536 [Spatholobus suberectus]|nr:hypothetical protein E2542_SST23536 [Spatholobus suberectus]